MMVDRSEKRQIVEHRDKREERGKWNRFESVQSRTFADVGGMEEFKKLAEMKIILPFSSPELFRRFGRKAGGGILMYGPPGCGKTFLAGAIAGECSASFFNVGIDDILDMYVGNSEKNLADLFRAAREARPSVVFIDEIDALGRRRDLTRHSSITTTVNALLREMDGLGADNDDILVVGATNAVWDVDNALKRPGRFDRVLFVPPPDEASRREILDLILDGIPTESIDTGRLARMTDEYSGADLRSLVDRAGERVLEDILRGGRERGIRMDDFKAVLNDMEPSTREWIEISKNYVEFANESGLYNDLKSWLENRGGRIKRMGFF